MTELKTKPFDKLEVGKTYLSRGGKIVKIIGEKPSHWPFQQSDWPFYCEDFTYRKNGSESFNEYEEVEKDLIAEVIEKPVYRVKAGSEALYHDPRVTMEQVGELMAQDGEFKKLHAWDIPVNGVTPREIMEKHLSHQERPMTFNFTAGKFSKDQYRAALDDFIHGGDSKDTRDVIKDALRVMGGV